MRTSIANMLLTAVTILAVAAAFLVPSADAQVPNSSLQGIVCSPANVYYIRAPDPGEEACQRGMPNATVHLTKAGPLGNSVGATDRSVLTDAKGAYSIAEIADGDYAIAVTHAGFDDLNLKVTVSGASTKDVTLQPHVVDVSGRIIGPKGEAVRDAQVSACCSGEVARSGTDGTFKLAVQAGWQVFNVNDAPGYQGLSEERFADGTQNLAFTLLRVPPQDATIAGTVRDQDGNPLADVRVDLYNYGGFDSYPTPMADCDGCADAKMMPVYYGGQNHTFTDAAGRYALHLNGGTSANLNINLQGYAPFSANFAVGKDETVTQDAKLMKYPAKTAHIVGQLPAGLMASINLRSPAYGIYECSDGGMMPQPMPMEASAEPASDSSEPDRGTSTGSSGGGVSSSSMSYPAYPQACAIHVNDDGSFEGDVTPGYTIVDVYPQADCSKGSCDAAFYPWSKTLVLAAEVTTTIDVQLKARPGPDAVVTGYIVDGETGKAIPEAQVSFSALDGYGYGFATTDADGSYGLKLRSGAHQVNVYVQGFYSWAGTVDVGKGSNDFDIKLTEGTDVSGGCCVMYVTAEGGSGSAQAMKATDASAAPMPGMASMTTTSGPSAQESEAANYEDLGGGLGPYDASKRTNQDGEVSKASPAAIAALAMLTLLGLAGLRRRS